MNTLFKELYFDRNKCDSTYLALYDATEGINFELKNYIDELWNTYKVYADNKFYKQIQEYFTGSFWEMSLSNYLINSNIKINSKDCGPDIIINNILNINIEAVASKKGLASKIDSVPDMKIGIASCVPKKEIILRITNSFDTKQRIYQNYLRDEIISEDAINIIAINTSELQFTSNESNLFSAIYSLGDLTYDFQKNETFYRKRNLIFKNNGDEVKTDLFRTEEYTHISAIIFSNYHIGSTNLLKDKLIIAHNPYAKVKLPIGSLSISKEYTYEIESDTIILLQN